MNRHIGWAVFALAVLLAVLLAVSAWFVSSRNVSTHALGVTAPARVVGTAAALAASSVRLAAPAPAVAASAPASVAQQYWDLCGVGRVPVPPGLSASSPDMGGLNNLPAPVGVHAATEAMVRMHAALPGQGPRGQALALLMDGAPLEGLVKLAKETADPAVLQWALMKCHDQPEKGACADLSPRALTRLDPNNAMAWLLLAAREPKAEAEWWAGIRASKRIVSHASAMSAAAWNAVPADVPLYLRLPMAEFVIGMEAALPDPTLFVAFKSCRTPLSGQRQQNCAALAELAVATGNTLGLRGLGIQLGELAGWPKERTQQLRSETDRLVSVLVNATGNDPQPFSCASVARMGQWVQQRHAEGELAAALSLERSASAPR